MLNWPGRLERTGEERKVRTWRVEERKLIRKWRDEAKELLIGGRGKDGMLLARDKKAWSKAVMDLVQMG